MKSAFHVPGGSIGDSHAMTLTLSRITIRIKGSNHEALMNSIAHLRGIISGFRQRSDTPFES